MSGSAFAIRCGAVVIFALVGLPCGPASGLIISTSHDLADTEVAAGFAYWDNVGWRGTSTGSSDGTCIYLGDSWVLTANHVRVGQVVLGGVTYAPIADTGQRIGGADLLVFRIANPPDLPSVPITELSLTEGMSVRMLGTGRDQETDRTYWRVSGSTWTESNPGLANAAGYKWAATRIKRWGTNEIHSVFQNSGHYYFRTSFDKQDTSYEAHGADKDSGAPVFIDNGGSWELAGLLVGLTGWQGQPDAGIDWVSWHPTSGNETTMHDLTYYRQAILDATPEPEPLPGDLNGDDYVSQSDLDLVLDSWGQYVDSGHPADPSGDGFVGQTDLDWVLDNWGNGTPPPLGAPAPEPTAAILMAVAGPVVLSRRRG